MMEDLKLGLQSLKEDINLYNLPLPVTIQPSCLFDGLNPFLLIVRWLNLPITVVELFRPSGANVCQAHTLCTHALELD